MATGMRYRRKRDRRRPTDPTTVDRRSGFGRRDSDAHRAREALAASLLAARPGTVTHYQESARVELRGGLVFRINYQGTHVIMEADHVSGAMAVDIIEMMNARLVVPFTE